MRQSRWPTRALHRFMGEAKVSEKDTSLVNQDVLRLDVPVLDTTVVQVE